MQYGQAGVPSTWRPRSRRHSSRERINPARHPRCSKTRRPPQCDEGVRQLAAEPPGPGSSSSRSCRTTAPAKTCPSTQAGNKPKPGVPVLPHADRRGDDPGDERGPALRPRLCPSRGPVSYCPPWSVAPRTWRCVAQRGDEQALILRLSGVTKIFGKQARAVDDLSLEVEHGEFVTLLGPCGCGKTTTLRMVAGLEKPDAGRDHAIGGALVSRRRAASSCRPTKRNIGMVFQSYAIWPHMTVFDNVAYPLRVRARARQRDQRARGGTSLALVGLGGLAERPAPSSRGGQQQRVALARALVYRAATCCCSTSRSATSTPSCASRCAIELKLLQQRSRTSPSSSSPTTRPRRSACPTASR